MGGTNPGTKLEIEGLKKSFGDRLILKGVNLRVSPGEFVAIVGRSGCGKSTLLRLMAGLETPTGGRVLQDGEPVRGIHPSVRIMFQDSRLLPWQKVINNVALGVTENKGEKRERALDLLREVGLEEYGEGWPAVLSGGQRQRVALARALVSRPQLLLLDEPLGALDALTRMEMQGLIERLWREQGFTALLVTHDVEEAVALADRVILLEEGKVALDLSINLPRPRHRNHSLFASLVETILGRVMMKNFPASPQQKVL